jgi:hypothetical protein
MPNINIAIISQLRKLLSKCNIGEAYKIKFSLVEGAGFGLQLNG